MKKITLVLVLLVLARLLIPSAASAGELRTFVSDFTVTGQPADLKTTLKSLFSSRMAGEGFRVVDSAAEADVIVSGSFTQLGKVFSLDAVAKSPTGKQLASGFEQGEELDALIPAIGKVSTRLKAEILKAAPAAAAPVKATQAADRVSTPEIVHNDQTPQGSEPLPGVRCALAAGKPLAGGNELVIADSNAIGIYRQTPLLKLVTEAKIPLKQKLIAVDTGSDAAGNVLVYATIIDYGVPASSIYRYQDGSLKAVAENLPYFFRAIALNGGAERIYAQRMGEVDDYDSQIFEAAFENGALQLKNPIKMPRFGNIFSFNSFRDGSGKLFLTALSKEGLLAVYSDKGEELWTSSDRFGGSENSFEIPDRANKRNSWTLYRTKFIEQRITVTAAGEVIVPQNSGFFVGENARAYSKSSLVCLKWNGTALEERWRTKQSQNYLADYLYRPATGELVLLEVLKRRALFTSGASALRAVRVE